MGTGLCWLLQEARVFFFFNLILPLPFTERAGFRIGCPDWPVIVEEEQDPHREERASGGAGGTHQGGGEELGGGRHSCGQRCWTGSHLERPSAGLVCPEPRAACPGVATWTQHVAFL